MAQQYELFETKRTVRKSNGAQEKSPKRCTVRGCNRERYMEAESGRIYKACAYHMGL